MKPRPVIVVPVWVSNLLWLLLFWLPIAAGVLYLFWWIFLVPSTSTRAMLCPKHADRVELYDAAEALRPLKEYEFKARAESERYLESWCQ
jgi:hypothetical protein